MASVTMVMLLLFAAFMPAALALTRRGIGNGPAPDTPHFGQYKVDPFVGSKFPQGSLSFDTAAPPVPGSPLLNKQYRNGIMAPLPGMPGYKGGAGSGGGSR